MATNAAPVGGGFIPGGLFSPDALETNRAGRLTDVQRGQFRNIDRNWRKGMLGFAGILFVIGLLVLTSTGPAPNAAYRPLAGGIAIVIAIAVILYAMPGADRLSGDLRGGRVLTLEGAMEKHHADYGHSAASETYYLDVVNSHFEVSRAEYDAAPSAGWVRIYYLPKSHKVVNLERLPDPAPAHPGPTTPQDVQHVLHDAIRAKGEAHHEAMAEMDRIGREMQAMRVESPVAPATPTPNLATAILGAWAGGPFTLTFAADGTMKVTTLIGRTMEGHWSVDSQGRLHADAMGGEQVGNAWVEGDTLTLALGKEGLRLQRVTS